MLFFNSTKSNLTRSKSAAMVLVLCFSVIVLFGSPLHDHDLKSSHVDLDCISCHLVHVNVGFEQDGPDFFVALQEAHSVAMATASQITPSIYSVSTRAPPIIC